MGVHHSYYWRIAVCILIAGPLLLFVSRSVEGRHARWSFSHDPVLRSHRFSSLFSLNNEANDIGERLPTSHPNHSLKKEVNKLPAEDVECKGIREINAVQLWWNQNVQNVRHIHRYLELPNPLDKIFPSPSADAPSPSISVSSTGSPMSQPSQSPLPSNLSPSLVIPAQSSSNVKTVLIAVLVTAIVTSLIAGIIFFLYHKLKSTSKKPTENSYSSTYDNPLLDSSIRSHMWKLQGNSGIPSKTIVNHDTALSLSIASKHNESMNGSFVNKVEKRLELGSPEWVGPVGFRAASKPSSIKNEENVPNGKKYSAQSIALPAQTVETAVSSPNVVAPFLHRLPPPKDLAKVKVVPGKTETELVDVSKYGGFWTNTITAKPNASLLADAAAGASSLSTSQALWFPPALTITKAELLPTQSAQLSIPLRPSTNKTSLSQPQVNATFADVSQLHVPSTTLAAEFAPSDAFSHGLAPLQPITFVEASRLQVPTSVATEFAPLDESFDGLAPSPYLSTKALSGVSGTINIATLQQPSLLSQRQSVTPSPAFTFTPQSVPPLPLPPALVSAAIVKAKVNSSTSSATEISSSVPVKAVAAALTSEASQVWRKPIPPNNEFLSSVPVKTVAAALDNQASQALAPPAHSLFHEPLKQPSYFVDMETLSAHSLPLPSSVTAFSTQALQTGTLPPLSSLPSTHEDVASHTSFYFPAMQSAAGSDLVTPSVSSQQQRHNYASHLSHLSSSNGEIKTSQVSTTTNPFLDNGELVEEVLLSSTNSPAAFPASSRVKGPSPHVPAPPANEKGHTLPTNVKAPSPPPPPPPPPPPFSSNKNGPAGNAKGPPPPPPPPPPTSRNTVAANVKAPVPPPPPTNGKGPPPPPPLPLATGLPRAPAPPPAPGVKGPPPPPPSSGGRPPHPSRPPSAPQSDSAQNVSKLKPLHWDKVRADPSQSMVWDRLKTGSFQLNEDEIALLFGQTATTSTMKALNNPSTVVKKGILDAKKAQNIAIQLRALNISTQDICDSLLEGGGLSSELLEVLVRMAPTQEEQRGLINFQGDRSELGPAERFLKAVLEIPNAFQRLDAMKYRAGFKEDLVQAKELLCTLEVACTQLRDSRMFLKILEAVLKTGNRMNKSTNRGEADAFKLDTLLKLTDVKSENGKTTLLHWVVEQIIKAEGMRAAGLGSVEDGVSVDPQKSEELKRTGLEIVVRSCAELDSVKKAAGIDADALAQSVLRLASGLSSIQGRLKSSFQVQAAASGIFPTEDTFGKNMDTFCSQAEEDVTKLKQEHGEVFDKVKKLTAYYHGNLRETQPLRVFMIVRDFLFLLDKVCKELAKPLKMTIRG